MLPSAADVEGNCAPLPRPSPAKIFPSRPAMSGTGYGPVRGASWVGRLDCVPMLKAAAGTPEDSEMLLPMPLPANIVPSRPAMSGVGDGIGTCVVSSDDVV